MEKKGESENKAMERVTWVIKWELHCKRFIY